MSRIEMFLKEMEAESKITRKMLSIIPDDKYDWKPHPKSMTIRQLATHIAELTTWAPMVLTTSELDFATMEYTPAPIEHTQQLMELFEKNLSEGKAGLAAGRDEQLSEPWTLRNGEQIYSTEPKADVIRMSFSQIIHHRAQLGVFLRLLDIPIPGSYGPSADVPF